MFKIKKYKRLSYLFLYLIITLGATYFMPRTISSVWYVILLILYYRSVDESFWLAFFIIISDGFIGFFGAYSTVITLIPGLPGIDMPQIYILLSLYKIRKKNIHLTTYYGSWTKLLLVYLCLLVGIGIINGLSGGVNVYFRIVKLILPLFLIYTVPRLVTNVDEIKKLFDLLFVFYLTAFAAQIFTVFTGFSPANNFKLPEYKAEDEEAKENLRSFYNCAITLMNLLAALFFLSMKNEKYYKKAHLYIIIGMTFFMAFLSASRGWIIGIGITIALFFIIVERAKNIGRIGFIFILLIAIGMGSEKVRERTLFSMERFMTLDALASGDLSAGGTLSRLNERGPIVMEAWAENPIFGWGFSNVYFEKNDGHVGNQNILLLSGIVGFSLLMIFLLFINFSNLMTYRSFTDKSKYKSTPLVFISFFIGYFIIHSSSGQQIGFTGYPIGIFPQAVFLTMSSIIYTLCREERIAGKQLNNK